MRKSGFTLAELIIALGIIGVASALIAPAITNLMPDKDKVIVLNCYNSLTAATENMLSDTGIYYQTISEQADESVKYTCEGLACTGKPFVYPYNSDKYQGAEKYKNILFDLLGIADTNGLAPNKVQWTVNSDGSGGYIVSIQIKSTKGNTYKFSVDKYGTVLGADEKTEKYLKDPLDLRNKKE